MSAIVCVGAHPDDVEIGMGGTVAGLVSRGHAVTIVDLTDGEPTPYGTPETRAAEADQAARTLGAARVTLSQPNRSLFDTVEARTELAEVLRRVRPDIVFVPYAEDAHPDHVAAHDIVMAARFYAKFTKTEMTGEPHYPRRMYRYMAVHLRLVREPSFVVDISGELDAKMRALAAYDSQFGVNPANAQVLDAVRMQAGLWGATIGVAAGEPFFALETVGVARLEDLV